MHKIEIKKGNFGEVSKITEEYLEFIDSVDQGDKVMQICELTDLIGAISGYSEKYFNLSIEDLAKFSEKVKNSKINEKG